MARAPPGGDHHGEMDRDAIRRSIDRPRSMRRRVTLGDVDRLHPGDASGRSLLSRGRVVALGILAAAGALVLRAIGRRS